MTVSLASLTQNIYFFFFKTFFTYRRTKQKLAPKAMGQCPRG